MLKTVHRDLVLRILIKGDRLGALQASAELLARDDFDTLYALHKKTCEILGWEADEA